jgi:hypothetical protein
MRVTSMQERLRQVDPYKYDTLSIDSPSYVSPRQTPGLLETGRDPYSIQYFKLTLKSVAYIFVTSTIALTGG